MLISVVSTKTNADNWIFINGESLAILLDFNVDGPVFELIDEIEKEKRHDR
jgi:hypothetical protein